MRLSIMIVPLAFALSQCAAHEHVSGPTMPKRATPKVSACTPSAAALAEIEKARAEDDGSAALARAKALNETCPSMTAALELADTYAYFWIPEEAKPLYERAVASGTPDERTRAKAALAKLADVPVRREPKGVGAASILAARKLMTTGLDTELAGDIAHAAEAFEMAYRATGDPTALALVGHAFDWGKQPAVARRWYARALAVAEHAAKSKAMPVVRTDYADEVRSVAFAPDGRQLAAGSSDGLVRVWDLERPGAPVTFGGFDDEVRSVAFNADGTLLGAGSRDGNAHVVDVVTGARVADIQWDSPIDSVAFSPGGKFFATAGVDGTVRLWETATGTRARVFPGNASEIFSIAFAPATRACHGSPPSGAPMLLAAGTNAGTVEVWEIQPSGAGALIKTLRADKWGVRGVAFSPDGTRLAVAGGEGTKLIDACNWAPPRALNKHFYRTNAVAFSSNGLVIDGTADKMHDGRTSYLVEFNGVLADRVTYTDTQFHDVVDAVAGHPTLGGRVAAGADDGQVRIIDENGKSQTLANNANVPFDISASADGRTLVECGYDRAVTRWSLARGERTKIATFGATVLFCKLGARGNRIVAGADGDVRVLDLATGQQIAALKPACSVQSAALDPSETRVVTGCSDGTVTVWDVATAAALATIGPKAPNAHTKSVDAVVFAPDGRTFSTAGADRTIRVWDAKTFQASGAPFTGFSEGIDALAISHDGTKLAAGGGDKDVLLFDVSKRGDSGKALVGHRPMIRTVDERPYGVRSLAFSGDDKYVLSTSWDQTVRSFDTSTGSGKVVAQLASPGRAVMTAAGGRILYVVSRDGQIMLYAARGGDYRPIATFFGAGEDWVVTTPTGEVDASPPRDGRPGGARFVTWRVGDAELRYYVAWARRSRANLLVQSLDAATRD